MSSPSFFRGPSSTAGVADPGAMAERSPGGPLSVDRPYAAPVADRRVATPVAPPVAPPVTPPVAPPVTPPVTLPVAAPVMATVTAGAMHGIGAAPVVFSEVVLRAAASRSATAEPGMGAGAVASAGTVRRAALANMDVMERTEAAAVVLEALAARLRRGERLLGDPTDPAVVAEVLSAMLAGKSRIG